MEPRRGITRVALPLLLLLAAACIRPSSGDKVSKPTVVFDTDKLKSGDNMNILGSAVQSLPLTTDLVRLTSGDDEEGKFWYNDKVPLFVLGDGDDRGWTAVVQFRMPLNGGTNGREGMALVLQPHGNNYNGDTNGSPGDLAGWRNTATPCVAIELDAHPTSGEPGVPHVNVWINNVLEATSTGTVNFMGGLDNGATYNMRVEYSGISGSDTLAVTVGDDLNFEPVLSLSPSGLEKQDWLADGEGYIGVTGASRGTGDRTLVVADMVFETWRLESEFSGIGDLILFLFPDLEDPTLALVIGIILLVSLAGSCVFIARSRVRSNKAKRSSTSAANKKPVAPISAAATNVDSKKGSVIGGTLTSNNHASSRMTQATSRPRSKGSKGSKGAPRRSRGNSRNSKTSRGSKGRSNVSPRKSRPKSLTSTGSGGAAGGSGFSVGPINSGASAGTLSPKHDGNLGLERAPGSGASIAPDTYIVGNNNANSGQPAAEANDFAERASAGTLSPQFDGQLGLERSPGSGPSEAPNNPRASAGTLSPKFEGQLGLERSPGSGPSEGIPGAGAYGTLSPHFSGNLDLQSPDAQVAAGAPRPISQASDSAISLGSGATGFTLSSTSEATGGTRSSSSGARRKSSKGRKRKSSGR